MNANRIESAARRAAMIAMMFAAGASYASDGLPSNSPTSQNNPGVAAVAKTRAQVRAELDQSIRSGETVTGFTTMSARDLDPERFARSETSLAGVNASR